MLDFLMGLAQSKTSNIARITGKSEAEIKSALEQGRKYLPDIKNSKDGGRGVMQQLGIGRDFVDEMYNKFGHYADRIPGVGRAALDSAYRNLTSSMGTPAAPNCDERKEEHKGSDNFDRTKYKKI